VAVEYIGMIIERDAYATTTLRDGDVTEIVRMVGGGSASIGSASAKRTGPTSP